MKHTEHVFHDDSRKAASRTLIVMWLTGLMMIIEIITGTIFHSMALLADGWHMSTHMTAFLIAVIAYHAAEKNRTNPRFSFGTGKIGILGGYTSSILLLVVAAVMIYESFLRFLHPVRINFREALVIAVIGLVVNLVSALILKNAGADHGYAHDHNHSHDKNLKAAYIHVIADAFTSVTAIIALVVGLFSGSNWIDSLMGILGSIVILAWAYGIIRDTVVILTDYFPKDSDLDEVIKKTIEALPQTRIHDLHIWQICSGKYAAIIGIATAKPMSVEEYYKLVNIHEELVHISIQINAE